LGPYSSGAVLNANLWYSHQYYVDNLRVFRFIQNRDSVWRNHVLGTDDVNTQWRQVLALMHTDVIYALSPQAKGKIERPYRWMQDRIVRTWRWNISLRSRKFGRGPRKKSIATTIFKFTQRPKKFPAIRFDKAKRETIGVSSFTLPQGTSPVKIFLHPSQSRSGWIS